MNNPSELFRQMTDTVVITDAYGYVLDFNRLDALKGLKKGMRLTKLLPDAFTEKEGKLETDHGFYHRITSPVSDGKKTMGYTVLLTDITEEEILSRQSHEKSVELKTLIKAKQDANQKLSEYALEVKNLSEYAEQLRIARSIHDDSGHAITEIYTISQMCLKLMDDNLQDYKALIEEGNQICKKAGEVINMSEYNSLEELLTTFERRSSFPISISMSGREPDFMKDKYQVIERILKEAYHNTLEHSLADTLNVNVDGSEESFTLTVRDNGKFRGTFEPGFGLDAMRAYVVSSGGTLQFLTEEGKGFGIVASWRNSDE